MHILRVHPSSRSGRGHCGGRAGKDGAAGRGRALSGRRHHADRSDEAERRNSHTRRSISIVCRSTALKPHPVAACRSVRWSATRTWRMMPQVQAGVFGSVAGDPARRLSANPQYGHRRGQPAAANTLRVLPGHGHGVQQARARQWMSGNHRPQSNACHPGHERAMHRDESIRHVRRVGSAGSHHSHSGNEGRACRRLRRFPSSARQYATS